MNQEGESVLLLETRGIGAVKDCLCSIVRKSLGILWQSSLDAIEKEVFKSSLCLVVSYCLSACFPLMES